MRTLALSLSLAALLFPVAGLAQSNGGGYSMQECDAAMVEINADLPMELDTITTWTKTSCKDTGGNTVQLVYENVVKDGNPITQENLDTVLPSILMSWCFGPTLAPLMQMVDTINYQYHFENGQKIGELTFSFAECIAEQ